MISGPRYTTEHRIFFRGEAPDEEFVKKRSMEAAANAGRRRK
jgi:hypothetical protein